MKCATHQQDAIVVCAYCGKALCPACERVRSPRAACSQACADALARSDRAVDSILRRTVETTRRSGYFLLAVGLAFLAMPIYGFNQRPDIRPPHVLAAVMGITLPLFGIWNYFSAKRRE
jgi:hypothetical protein